MKELDREDVRKRPGGIVLRMIWKVQACPKRMCSPGINGEGELRGQPANPGSPGKMAVITECVCVCVCVIERNTMRNSSLTCGRCRGVTISSTCRPSTSSARVISASQRRQPSVSRPPGVRNAIHAASAAVCERPDNWSSCGRYPWRVRQCLFCP